MLFFIPHAYLQFKRLRPGRAAAAFYCINIIFSTRRYSTNCSVILDLLPATLQCSFSGVYKQYKTVNIEVLYTRRATGNQALKDFSKQLEALLEKTPAQIVRVAGQLRCLQFLDRGSGMEIKKYQLAADSITVSKEKKSIVGHIFVEGRIRALSNESPRNTKSKTLS